MPTRIIVAVAIIIFAIAYITVATADIREACAIQGRLKVLGYYRGTITTCADTSATREAIEAFQRDNDLPPVGKVGPATYRKLFGRSRGDTRPVVDLKANGF
jgi:hypothetical protein